MKIVDVAISDLNPAEYNPRKLGDHDRAQLENSLREFGFVDPVVVNSRKSRQNVIIGGHQRVRVWESMGNTTVPVFYIDLDLEQERELNIRLNRNSGEWDLEKLASEFDMGELAAWGFNDVELDELFDNVDDMAVPEENIQEPPAEPITQPGDLWLLGAYYQCDDCGAEYTYDQGQQMNGVCPCG